MRIKRAIHKYLLNWKDKADRKPLILRGARQVGKTMAVEIFAEHFENYIYLNLENISDRDNFDGEISIEQFEAILKTKYNKSLVDDKTLVFIDEIQVNPYLITLLRFFYELRPAIHVIAAGSFFEATITETGVSIPVGRIEYAYLNPLTFIEFLVALEKEEFVNYIEKIDLLNFEIIDAIHAELIELFRLYTLIGGMPEIVANYAEHRNINLLTSIYNSILSGYADDVYKYATSSKTKYLDLIIKEGPYYAGSLIKFDNFADSGYKSREVREAFTLLEKVMLLTLVPATWSTEIPIHRKNKPPHKLLFIDAGFTNYLYQVKTPEQIDKTRYTYKGSIYEQIIGQNILANNMANRQQLYYWTKDSKKGSAEVDYCIQGNSKITAIEVKYNDSKGKSIDSFLSDTNGGIALKLYSGYPKKELTAHGYNVVSLPFYMVNYLDKFL